MPLAQIIEGAKESLRSVVGKINAAISAADTAKSTADTALSNSETTQSQLDTIVLNNGQSDAEVLQARGTFPLLYNRLDDVDVHLAESAQKVYKPIKVNKLSEPLVAFSFDHNNIANFTTLRDSLNGKGVPGNFAIYTTDINTFSTNSSSFVDPKILQDMINEGHEFMNHGLNAVMLDTGGISDNTLYNQMDVSYKYLSKLGIQPKTWITQSSSLYPDYIPYTLKHHSIAFGDWQAADIRNPNASTMGEDTVINQSKGLFRCNVEVCYDTDGTEYTADGGNYDGKLSVLKKIVDYCIANNRAVIFHHHEIDNGRFPISYLEQLIDYVKSKNVTITTCSELFNRLTNAFIQQQDIKVLQNEVRELKGVIQENLLDDTTFKKLNEFTDYTGAISSTVYTDEPLNDGITLNYNGTQDGIKNTIIEKIINSPLQTIGYDFPLIQSILVNGANIQSVNLTCKYYSAPNKGGTLLANYSTVLDLIDSEWRELTLKSNNYFGYGGAQCMTFGITVVPKAGLSGNVTIINPTLNRGVYTADFIKKRSTVDWTALTPSNGWVNFVGTTSPSPLQYRIKDDVVEVRGAIYLPGTATDEWFARIADKVPKTLLYANAAYMKDGSDGTITPCKIQITNTGYLKARTAFINDFLWVDLKYSTI